MPTPCDTVAMLELDTVAMVDIDTVRLDCGGGVPERRLLVFGIPPGPSDFGQAVRYMGPGFWGQ